MSTTLLMELSPTVSSLSFNQKGEGLIFTSNKRPALYLGQRSVSIISTLAWVWIDSFPTLFSGKEKRGKFIFCRGSAKAPISLAIPITLRQSGRLGVRLISNTASDNFKASSSDVPVL